MFTDAEIYYTTSWSFQGQVYEYLMSMSAKMITGRKILFNNSNPCQVKRGKNGYLHKPIKLLTRFIIVSSARVTSWLEMTFYWRLTKSTKSTKTKITFGNILLHGQHVDM